MGHGNSWENSMNHGNSHESSELYDHFKWTSWEKGFGLRNKYVENKVDDFTKQHENCFDVCTALFLQQSLFVIAIVLFVPLLQSFYVAKQSHMPNY
jgi:hypothetical protein